MQFSFCQVSSVDDNKSELPKIKKESLQMETDVELYPNPAAEFLNITLKNSQLKNVQIEMYNVIGNKIEFELDAVNSVNYKINVKELNSGYYLLIIKDQMSRYNKAFKFRKL
jgi:hypothetical protein